MNASNSSETFEIEVLGEHYKEGSSDPWRGGTYRAKIEADSRYEAVIELLEGLGEHGRVVSEDGDCDWTLFDSERDITIRVKGAE